MSPFSTNIIMTSIEKNLQNAEAKPHIMYNPSGYNNLPRNPGDASALLRSYIPDIANPITAQLSYGRKAIPNLVNIPKFIFIDISRFVI